MSITHEQRDLVRRYLLDTANDAERRLVDKHLADSAEWREALEAEREALAALDALVDAEPSRDLATAVMERIAEGEEQPAPVSPWRSALRYGIATAVLVVAVFAGVLPTLERTREAARRASSENNLKQLGLVLKMYANESKGEKLPPLAPYEGVWTIDVAKVYPGYLTDISVLVNPRLPDADELRARLVELVQSEPVDWEEVTRITARSYTYLGYSVTSEEDLERLAKQYAKLDVATDEDLPTEEGAIYRLREGIERFFITDINNPAATASAQADLPVMFETVPTMRGGQPKERAVLFMDGHVERIAYDEAFPASRRVDDILNLSSP